MPCAGAPHVVRQPYPYTRSEGVSRVSYGFGAVPRHSQARTGQTPCARRTGGLKARGFRYVSGSVGRSAVLAAFNLAQQNLLPHRSEVPMFEDELPSVLTQAGPNLLG